eukprot:1301956-Prymnesium_polylepis.3
MHSTVSSRSAVVRVPPAHLWEHAVQYCANGCRNSSFRPGRNTSLRFGATASFNGSRSINANCNSLRRSAGSISSPSSVSPTPLTLWSSASDRVLNPQGAVHVASNIFARELLCALQPTSSIPASGLASFMNESSGVRGGDVRLFDSQLVLVAWTKRRLASSSSCSADIDASPPTFGACSAWTNASQPLKSNKCAALLCAPEVAAAVSELAASFALPRRPGFAYRPKSSFTRGDAVHS